MLTEQIAVTFSQIRPRVTPTRSKPKLMNHRIDRVCFHRYERYKFTAVLPKRSNLVDVPSGVTVWLRSHAIRSSPLATYQVTYQERPRLLQKNN